MTGRVVRRVNRMFAAGETETAIETERSNLDNISYHRFLQNKRESGTRRNPDHLVSHILGKSMRRRCLWQGMAPFRRMPLYHYILARTKFYDAQIVGAISSDIRQIVLLGAGTDTRAYRFREEIERKGISFIETDQEAVIVERIAAVKAFGAASYITRAGLDLEDADYQKWIGDSGFAPNEKTLFVVEGVTPYVTRDEVSSLLRFVENHAGHGSKVAYDFKLTGANDEFGMRADGTKTFRLPNCIDDVFGFNKQFGLDVKEFCPEKELQSKYRDYDSHLFMDDASVVVELA